MHDQGRVPGGPNAHLCHMLDPVVSDGFLMEPSHQGKKKKKKPLASAADPGGKNVKDRRKEQQ